MERNDEQDRDLEIKVTFSTYGNQEQRYKTAAEVKRILEVKLQRKVDVDIKHGKEWYPVERMDRNALQAKEAEEVQQPVPRSELAEENGTSDHLHQEDAEDTPPGTVS